MSTSDQRGVPMVVVAGHLDFADREARDGVLAAGAELQAATRAEEPGCEAYCMSADPVIDTRVLVHEIWADEASLAAHFEHPYFTQMRAVFHRFERTGGEVRKFRCDLSEPMHDPEGNVRADFFTARG